MAKLKPCFHHIYIIHYNIIYIYTVHNRSFLLQGNIRALLGTLRWCSYNYPGAAAWGGIHNFKIIPKIPLYGRLLSKLTNNHFWIFLGLERWEFYILWLWRPRPSSCHGCQCGGNGCLLYCLLVEGHQHLFDDGTRCLQQHTATRPPVATLSFVSQDICSEKSWYTKLCKNVA